MDGDGVPDLFFGNYWVRNPGRLGVAWRLFTINTFFDTPAAALAALGVWDHNTLIWAETSAKQARIAVFEAPEDRKQLWKEHRLEPLDEPKAVLVHPQGVFIGHAGGVVLESPAGDGWRRTTIAQGFPVLKLVSWRDNVVAICPDGVRWVFPLR